MGWTLSFNRSVRIEARRERITGDILDVRLRKGRAHTAEGGLEFITEVLDRAERLLCGKATVRFDAGYPGEALMSALEARGTHYVARVRRNAVLDRLAPAAPAGAGAARPGPVHRLRAQDRHDRQRGFVPLAAPGPAAPPPARTRRIGARQPALQSLTRFSPGPWRRVSTPHETGACLHPASPFQPSPAGS